MRLLSEVSTLPPREWILLDDLSAAKKLTASDWVRMALAKPRLLPRTSELHGRLWAHLPTLVDWEALLEVTQFKTELVLQTALISSPSGIEEEKGASNDA